MTLEDKLLVLKDLCMRIPYGVFIKSFSGDDYGPVIDICYPQGVVAYMGQKQDAYSDDFLAYLRSTYSLSKEELIEARRLGIHFVDSDKGPIFDGFGNIGAEAQLEALEWLLKNHIDFRGLIEKGLALEAPKDMYKTE